jgi:hypothetical protein
MVLCVARSSAARRLAQCRSLSQMQSVPLPGPSPRSADWGPLLNVRCARRRGTRPQEPAQDCDGLARRRDGQRRRRASPKRDATRARREASREGEALPRLMSAPTVVSGGACARRTTAWAKSWATQSRPTPRMARLTRIEGVLDPLKPSTTSPASYASAPHNPKVAGSNPARATKRNITGTCQKRVPVFRWPWASSGPTDFRPKPAAIPRRGTRGPREECQRCGPR